MLSSNLFLFNIVNALKNCHCVGNIISNDYLFNLISNKANKVPLKKIPIESTSNNLIQIFN